MNPADPHALGQPSCAVPSNAPVGGIDFTDPRSPLAPYYLRASHVASATLLALIFVYFSLLTPLWHGEFWAHLRAGAWIADNAALPQREPFSAFSDGDRPYVDFVWLSEIAFQVIFRSGERMAGGDLVHQQAGGVELVRGMHGLMVALRFGLLLAAYRRWTGSLPWACVGVAIVLQLSALNSSIQRPLVFGEVCYAALLFLLLNRRPLSGYGLASIAVLFALWANMHDSFIAGLALLGVFLVGRIVEAARYEQGWSLKGAWTDTRARRLGLALVAAALAVQVNPYGPALVVHALEQARDDNLQTLIGWLPLDFGASAGPHATYLAILIVLALSQAFGKRPLTPTAVLMLVTFGVGPLLQRRVFVWWAPLIPVLLLPLWRDMGERLGATRMHFESIPSFRKTLLVLAIGVVAIVWCGATQVLTGRDPPPLEKTLSSGTPLALAQHLNPAYRRQWPVLADGLANYPERQFRGRIFASENLSDFLLWSLPEAQARELMFYNAPAVFPREHWRECLTVLDGSTGWWEILDRFRTNLVVIDVEMHPTLAGGLREDARWQVILDEAGGSKPDPRNRLFLAVRKQPL